jgi:hypothetical protein
MTRDQGSSPLSSLFVSRFLSGHASIIILGSDVPCVGAQDVGRSLHGVLDPRGLIDHEARARRVPSVRVQRKVLGPCPS